MTRAEARAILDCLRAGDDFPPAVVDMALMLTGDITPTGWHWKRA
jgi:hypothetical protein